MRLQRGGLTESRALAIIVEQLASGGSIDDAILAAIAAGIDNSPQGSIHAMAELMLEARTALKDEDQTPFIQADRLRFCRNVGIWCPVARSSGDVSAPVDTNLNTIVTATIPGGSMGPNGQVRFSLFAEITAVAETKALAIKFAGNTVTSTSITATNQSYRAGGSPVWITNQNDSAIQCTGFPNTNFGANNAAPNASLAVNTLVDQNITVDIQFSAATGTFKVRQWLLEVLYGA